MKNISKKINKSQEEKKAERQAGITLVALVITIIIIIILATVTIRFAFGDDGIIKRAELASDMYANDTAYTDQSMANVTAYLDGMLNGTIDGSGSGTDEPEPEPDTMGPTITNIETSATENSITITITAEDPSGLAESETYAYFINEVQQGVATTENTKTFTDLQAETEYTIKVIVKDKLGNVTTEDNIKVSTTAPAVPGTTEEAKPTDGQDGPEFAKTTPITDATGSNTVVIPGGFHLDEDSGTSVEEGIVIEDSNGNQFVWIPTGTYQTSSGVKTNELTRRNFSSTGATPISGDSTAFEYNGNCYYGEGNSSSVASTQIAVFKEYASPKSEANPNGNGGFYIGRYEQGTGNACKYNQTPYDYVTRDQAKSQAEAMYGEESSVVSELISSYAWDTALNFICQTNSAGYTLATTTSSSYGNIGTGSRKNTGVDVNDVYSKIHDLLGNCYEWTTEYCNYIGNPCVFRGGGYNGSVSYAAIRFDGYDTSTSGDIISFRTQLYVK